MPPHTTYLRVTPHSVLQLRIFTEHPLDAGKRWLIHPTDPALPKVVQAVKHLILPKLREENLRKFGAKAGGTNAAKGVKGKKRVKDVVSTDEFEVACFMTELGTRHSLLVKQKLFKDRKRKLGGNSTKMAEAMADGNTKEDAVMIREESPLSDDSSAALKNIPTHSPRKRRRTHAEDDDDNNDDAEVITSDQDDDENEDEDEDEVQDHSDEGDDKKKLSFKTSYDGFSIWGWRLVLIVKRKDSGSRSRAAGTCNAAMMGLKDSSSSEKPSGTGIMEEWISTQAAGEGTFDEDDYGD